MEAKSTTLSVQPGLPRLLEPGPIWIFGRYGCEGDLAPAVLGHEV